MKPQKWNTARLAIYGAFGGAAVVTILDWPTIVQQDLVNSLASQVGGAIGGAALMGLISGSRNFFVRRD